MITSRDRTVLVSLVLITLAALSGYSQYIPPNGTSSYDGLSSPLYLGGAGFVTTVEPPFSDSLNPASSGTRQRTTLDLSYINLAGLGDENGAGHILNTGITIPTKAGVFSGSGRFLSSSYDSVDLGSIGVLNLSFAKDLYPNLMVGAGLAFNYGSQESTDWGLGLDLGFLHYAHDVGFLQDFRWGGTLSNIGKGFAPDGGRDPFPALFTPAIGAQATVLRSYAFSLSLASDVSLPAVQDLRFSLGTEVGIRDTVYLRTGYIFDLAETNQGELPTPSLPLSFGATIKLKTALKEDIRFLDITERGWNRSEVRINLSATPLPGDVWAFGLGLNVPLGVPDKTPPDTETESPQEAYISPDLDGTQDSLDLPISITDERFVKGYQLIIKDEDGQVVRTIQNKDERPENVTFKNVIDRLLYVKAGISIPESLRWDGRTDQAELVPDARYSYTIEAWDDNGNTGVTPARTVVVDSTPPAAQIAAPYVIFSPNDDGNKDTLVIEQQGSSEDLWDGSVRGTDGQIVASFSWETQSPPALEWDGKMADGTLAPDGVYSYGLESVDRAGNRTTTALRGIIINTQATPIDLRVDRAFFSPNQDGVKDAINLIPDVPVVTGIERWQLNIRDTDGVTQKSYAGTNGAPGVTVFDGTGDGGRPLPQGSYTAILDLSYVNGNRPQATSPEFSIDLTPPKVSTRADLNIFSPNGDGRKDTVTLYQETSQEVGWAGVLTNSAGNTVLSFFWRGQADSPIIWDGRDTDGLPLPDGEYTYVLQTSDRAGNDAKSAPVVITLDTEETPVLLTTDIIAFSPNGDGTKERVSIRTHLKDQDRIDSYKLTIVDANDQAVRKITGGTGAPAPLSWDGRGDGGARLPDGEYRARLEVVYAKGNQPSVTSNAFVMDTDSPKITVAADRTLFSPDGDGNKDTVTLSQSSTPEALWEGAIAAPNGDPIRQYFWKGGAEDVVWDGTDENGNRVADGIYAYIVSSQDAAGNRTEKSVAGIRIDTRPTPVFVTATDDGFSPNGDDFRDTIGFNMYVNQSQEIEAWRLDIVHETAGVVETFSGRSAVPDSLVWDGSKVPEGEYQARLTVQYLKGNQPQSSTSRFRLDVSPPSITLSAAPQPFSPDNDGVDDEVVIGLVVRDLSPIDAWLLEILDPKGNAFTRFAGTGTPSPRILWDGLSVGGELVQAAEDYFTVLTISDVLGNVATERGTIPIDILVIRDGDKLKIQISSITFAPDTADYLGVDQQKAEKNLKTLKRLVEIFRKYRSYSIRIEGHAVNVNWANASLAAREEEAELLPLSTARAEAVKDGLVALGMDPDRITTAGLGGKHPVVPHGDLDNRWKSRRVEFILVRKE